MVSFSWFSRRLFLDACSLLDLCPSFGLCDLHVFLSLFPSTSVSFLPLLRLRSLFFWFSRRPFLDACSRDLSVLVSASATSPSCVFTSPVVPADVKTHLPPVPDTLHDLLLSYCYDALPLGSTRSLSCSPRPHLCRSITISFAPFLSSSLLIVRFVTVHFQSLLWLRTNSVASRLLVQTLYLSLCNCSFPVTVLAIHEVYSKSRFCPFSLVFRPLVIMFLSNLSFVSLSLSVCIWSTSL